MRESKRWHGAQKFVDADRPVVELWEALSRGTPYERAGELVCGSVRWHPMQK